jgi:hypothetical protein
MAENINALILPIGADPSQFEKSIKEVKDAIKSLKNEIESKPFNFVSPQSKQQLKDLESTLDRLQTSVQNTGAAFNKSVGPTKNATSALTSLSLVAQDAPFGFIGIQNNLPALIQSFGQLKAQAGGVQGALSQLGAALIGPAGLFLAFSAVTAAVTLAVKEYGSLTNAFDALFTSTSQATIAQRNYNKELKEGGKNLGSELSKVDLLSKGIANENLSREERLNYFFQAKKELPDLLAGLDEENILTKNGIKVLLANASARSKFLDLQVKQQAIGKVLNENYSEELDVQAKLVVEEKKRDKALRTITETQKSLNKATDKSSIKLFENILKQARKEFDFSVIAISKLKDELGKLQIVQSDYSGDLDGIVKGQGEYEKGVTRLTDGLTKLRNAQKEAGKEAKKNALKGDPIGTVTEGVQINNGVITSDIAALTKVIQANVRLTNASVDQMLRYRDSKLKQPTPLDLVPNKISKIPAVPMSPELSSQIGSTKLMLEETAANFATAREALTDVFFNPLTDLFTNFTENGKNAFKEFGKAILATIKQLVAKIIATGIINLLASILVPGGPQAASLLGTATGGGSKIGQAFGSAIRSVLGIKSIANPSFAGVGGGGMQMSGQVVFVQRGSDLVGVLNRTNGTINRVG